MDTKENGTGRAFAMRFLIASLAFIIGLAAHSVWDNRQRVNALISDFLANYQD